MKWTVKSYWTFFQDVDECKTEGDPESQETKEDNIDKSDNNLENVSKVIEEEETTKPPNVTAEPGLESNNDSGIVPNCSQGLTTTDESAENSDHENQISDKPSKVKSLTSEATHSATQFFKWSYKISHPSEL